MAAPTEQRVGPHGYIHGWIFVGIPAPGVKVFHPHHGHGTVTGKTGDHVKVSFGGSEHTFAHQPPSRVAPEPAHLARRPESLGGEAGVMTAAEAKKWGNANWHCNLAHKAATGMCPAQHAKELGRSAGMAKAPYGDVPYGDPGYLDADGNQASKSGKPGVKRYPLTADKVMAAWSYINQADNAGQYTAAQLSAIKGRIRSAMKQHGHQVTDDSGRSAGWADQERRYTPGRVEARTAQDGPRIGGYAIVFNKLSRNLGGFVERSVPGVVNQSRSLGWPNVVCRYNHDSNMVLGTTAGNTLALQPDNVGLDYEVLPPNSRADIVELVSRGDVQFSSYAFRVPQGGDEWGVTDQNYPMRTLHEVQLIDVAPVLDPAYPDATAGLRSLAAAMDAPFDDVAALAADDELRKFFVRTDNRGPAPKPKVTGAMAMMALMEKKFPDLSE